MEDVKMNIGYPEVPLLGHLRWGLSAFYDLVALKVKICSTFDIILLKIIIDR